MCKYLFDLLSQEIGKVLTGEVLEVLECPHQKWLLRVVTG